jgi:ABC-2 type transport system permease protein
VGAFNAGDSQPRVPAGVTLSVVELYPYVPYIQFLLPGSITLAIFVSAMIGGGIIYIDDKARGLHEGYLVTPISKLELILGFNLSGAIKAVLAGIVLTTLGSVIAGIPNPLEPLRLLKLLLVIILTSLALISMMFFLMVRVNDPLVPRATFGVLNTLLFFPSGAVYPIYGFPLWMRAIATVDPMTYAVHAFKTLLLKNTGIMAIAGDLTFLALFTLLMVVAETALFKRTL